MSGCRAPVRFGNRVPPTRIARTSDKIERAAYETTLRGLLEVCRTRFVVSSFDELRDLADITVMDWRSRLDQPETCRSHSSMSGDFAVLQHSSGTTGLKEGVALSHAAVLAQIDAYSLVAMGSRIGPDEVWGGSPAEKLAEAPSDRGTASPGGAPPRAADTR